MQVNPPLNRFQLSCCDYGNPKADSSVLNYETLVDLSLF